MSNHEHRHARRTVARPRVRGWAELQRRERHAFRRWLHSEQRIRKGFDALATALRTTLTEHVPTASEARDVWHAAAAVLCNCNDPATYSMQHAEIAYAWLHLLERYVRTWLALEQLLQRGLLPMGRYGVRVLDVGTGPGPSAFATHDFYAAMEDYARITNAASWQQTPYITCVERAPAMNHIRHAIAEHLASKGAPRSVLGMAGGLDDFSDILPTQERRQLQSRLQNQYDEYYDDRREEWHADPIHTPEEANREANAYRRYRLFTFSNFLTTLDTVAMFKANLEDILADATAGAVLLMIGGKGGCYPDIQTRMDQLADAGGFRRDDLVVVRSADAQLDGRPSEEVRWFYCHLKQLAGNLPASAVKLRKELGGDQPISFGSSAVHAFRKWS